MSVRIAILSLALCSCVSYQFTPRAAPISEAAERLRIYVTPEMALLPRESTLEPITAGQLAGLLEESGFSPVRVASPSEVPDDAPVASRGAHWTEEEVHIGRGLLWLFTFGLFPQFRSVEIGAQLQVQRTIASPPRLVEARWRFDAILGWLAIPLSPDSGYDWAVLVPSYSEFLDQDRATVRAAILDALEQPR